MKLVPRRLLACPELRRLARLLAKHGVNLVRVHGGYFDDRGRVDMAINAARAQGVSGRLKAAGPIETQTMAIASDLDVGHVVAVSLDDQPLATSGRVLLQVMSKEKASGFQTAPVSATAQRIVNLGTDPWLVKEFTRRVRFKRPDAAQLTVTAPDLDGSPLDRLDSAREIVFQPNTISYLINR